MRWKYTSKWSPVHSLKRNLEESLHFINLSKEKFNFIEKDKPMTLLKMEPFTNGSNKKNYSTSYLPTIIPNLSRNLLNSSSTFINEITKSKSISKWSGSTEKENMKQLLKKSIISSLKFLPMTEMNSSPLNYSKSTSPKLNKIHGISNTLKW